ncbi:hypothetical protein [Salinispora arenicola]|uniref:hypothetical protein n=1 Tax=Salinispora arenicola TaxID=168697 RepID=UPI0012BC313B|nr:hypothetical protein [Salinispora arenicola]
MTQTPPKRPLPEPTSRPATHVSRPPSAGKIKGVGKAFDGVVDAAKGSTVFRPVVTFGDDYLKMLRKHRNGGDLVTEKKGIFEGDFVKKPARLKKRIQEAVDRGTPKRNWGTNPDGSKRDGWVYDWDFGQPNKVGRLSPW